VTRSSSAKRYPRTARLNEAVLEVLADELERMNDPRLELVTLTGAKVSRDLSHATVYYSTIGATTPASGKPVNEAFADEAAAALHHAASHLRGALGRQLRVRQVPRLAFTVDPGIVSGQRIEEILRDIHHAEAESDEAGTAGGRQEES
jgi:ribosome-binding factor A